MIQFFIDEVLNCLAMLPTHSFILIGHALSKRNNTTHALVRRRLFADPDTAAHAFPFDVAVVIGSFIQRAQTHFLFSDFLICPAQQLLSIHLRLVPVPHIVLASRSVICRRADVTDVSVLILLRHDCKTAIHHIAYMLNITVGFLFK